MRWARRTHGTRRGTTRHMRSRSGDRRGHLLAVDFSWRGRALIKGIGRICMWLGACGGGGGVGAGAAVARAGRATRGRAWLTLQRKSTQMSGGNREEGGRRSPNSLLVVSWAWSWRRQNCGCSVCCAGLCKSVGRYKSRRVGLWWALVSLASPGDGWMSRGGTAAVSAPQLGAWARAPCSAAWVQQAWAWGWLACARPAWAWGWLAWAWMPPAACAPPAWA